MMFQQKWKEIDRKQLFKKKILVFFTKLCGHSDLNLRNLKFHQLLLDLKLCVFETRYHLIEKWSQEECGECMQSVLREIVSILTVLL